jgi:hypothetical protein
LDRINLGLTDAVLTEWDALTADLARCHKDGCERVCAPALALSAEVRAERDDWQKIAEYNGEVAQTAIVERDAALAELAEAARVIDAAVSDLDWPLAKKIAHKLDQYVTRGEELDKTRAELAKARDQSNATAVVGAAGLLALNERLADELAKAREENAADHVCASDGWGPCDAKPVWCDEHRLTEAELADHAIAEAAREWGGIFGSAKSLEEYRAATQGLIAAIEASHK